MREISKKSRTIWLRTDRAVVPTKTSDWSHLLAVQEALEHGVFAVADCKRPEFFEIEVDDHWYYIHISSRISGVHLIAVRAAVGEEVEDLDERLQRDFRTDRRQTNPFVHA
jgi:hypothetical protein